MNNNDRHHELLMRLFIDIFSISGRRSQRIEPLILSSGKLRDRYLLFCRQSIIEITVRCAVTAEQMDFIPFIRPKTMALCLYRPND